MTASSARWASCRDGRIPLLAELWLAGPPQRADLVTLP